MNGRRTGIMLVSAIATLAFSAAAAQTNACELTTVGGHRLYACVLGKGTPTVVLEAGARSHSAAWRPLVSRLTQEATVVSYDRAGLGQSEPGPFPRTTAQIARELRALLEQRGLSGPFLLVGHSAGGWMQLRFARLYPELVAGIVLIDVPPITFETDRLTLLTPHERAQREELLRNSRAQAPPGVQAEYAAVDWEPHFDWPGPLPNVPLVVITADGHQFGAQGDSATHERLWRQGQQEYARLLPSGRIVIAERSSHMVQQDRPELVADVILTTLRGTRGSLVPAARQMVGMKY